MRRNTRVAMRSGLCILLAYIFLVGPEWFNSLAQASIEYSSLSTLAWARAGDTIEYGYDANGSLISKVTRNGSGDVTESRAYEYDLRGRLAREVDMGLTPDDPADDAPIAEFAYDSSGIRVKKIDRLASTATYYLIDEQNHTGYAQVLEERTYVIAGGTETLDAAVYYTIGDDVISQTKVTYPGGVATFADTQYLLYDGHGSTRQLLNHTPDGSGEAVVAESYDYDSYGVMLGPGANPANTAGTSLLYPGEQYDSSLSQYYLRARYYDQSNGRFTSVDPYSGNTSDPQSLHKYTYCHNDPVMGLDPTGRSIATVGAMLIDLLNTMVIRLIVTAMTTPAIMTALTYAMGAMAIFNICVMVADPEAVDVFIASCGGDLTMVSGVLAMDIMAIRNMGCAIRGMMQAAPEAAAEAQNVIRLKWNGTGSLRDFWRKARRLQSSAEQGGLIYVGATDELRPAASKAQAAYREAVRRRLISLYQSRGLTEQRAVDQAERMMQTVHADHAMDLQVSGALENPNSFDNLWMLDSSTNSSIGKQLELECKRLGLCPGDTITGVIIDAPPSQ